MIISSKKDNSVDLMAVLNLAIQTINKKWAGNIRLKDWKTISAHRVRFTIRANKSGIRGASVSHSGRNSVAANWHVHGDLFDAIFELCPDAVITSRGNKITKDAGSWQDFNVGSQLCPRMASDCSVL